MLCICRVDTSLNFQSWCWLVWYVQPRAMFWSWHGNTVQPHAGGAPDLSSWELTDLISDGPLRRPSGGSHHITIYLCQSSELAGRYCCVSETASLSLQEQFLHGQSIDKRLYSVTLISKTIFPIFQIYFFISLVYFKHYIIFPLLS